MTLKNYPTEPAVWSVYVVSTLYVSLITVAGLGLLSVITYRDIGMIYLMAISIGSVFIRRYNVIYAAVLSGVCWNVFFMPPKFTFKIQHHEDLLLLLLYLVAGSVIGSFTNKLKQKEKVLKTEGQRATQLYSITKELSAAKDLDLMIQALHVQMKNIFDCEFSVFYRPIGQGEHAPLLKHGDLQTGADDLEIIEWILRNLKPAGKFTSDFSTSRFYFTPVLGTNTCLGVFVFSFHNMLGLSFDQISVIDAASRQLALGLERERLQQELRSSLVNEESERIYKTLLSSVSHEMRTPLAAIKGFASTLKSKDVIKNEEKVLNAANEISEGVERLDYVVQNLLDMSRLESGKLKLHLDYHDIKELISTAISKVKNIYPDKNIKAEISDDLPFFYIDYFLIEQAVENILKNACLYTPLEKPIDVSLSLDSYYLYIHIRDYGPGILGDNPNIIFNKFYRGNPNETGGLGLGLSICKAVIELHRGSIQVENISHSGANFIIRIPKELDRELTHYV